MGRKAKWVKNTSIYTNNVWNKDLFCGFHIILVTTFFLFSACAAARCTTGDLCYIAHPLKCNKFIMCSKNDVGDLYAQVMPCAFGTFWTPQGDGACEITRLVDCLNGKAG